MSDANDPLADVLAEMRDLAENRDWHNHTKQSNRERVSNLADRVEAAAKREREAYCDLCKDKDATIDRLLVERDRAIKARAPGNAAAMTKTQLQTIADLVAIAHDEYDGLPSYRDDLERFDRLLVEIKSKAQSGTGNAAAKWLYRLEYHDGTCGLWYDGSGNWCFERGIGSLDDCKTKSLPMDYDERYRQDGRSWFSSCSRKEDLLHWYSREDAKRLLSHGFVFTRYLATEYREYDQQTVFIKETCLYREEIDFESLWKSFVHGNAAAPREALENVERVARFCAEMPRYTPGYPTDAARADVLCSRIAELGRVARAALSAPARNCDVGTANDLHAAFVRHCDACNPPGGCCHRSDIRGMLDTGCASILKCFARFALDTVEGGAK